MSDLGSDGRRFKSCYPDMPCIPKVTVGSANHRQACIILKEARTALLPQGSELAKGDSRPARL